VRLGFGDRGGDPLFVRHLTAFVGNVIEMAVGLEQMTVTVGAPAMLDGREGRRVLADFYGALLGMAVVREDWLKIAKSRETPFQMALDGDGWSDDRPPRWGDPEHPQQIHLDVLVPDVDGAGTFVAAVGATLLHDGGTQHRVYADPAGHPFCLYADASAGDERGPGTVGRVVFDCFSPRHLATFYQGFLEVDRRTEDRAERVVLALGDERYPDLAFQHAVFVAPRWPDPAYPAQLHLDLRFGDQTAAAIERVERLGGIRLPKLADTEIFADPAGHPFCV
jgi:hypothetical protein